MRGSLLSSELRFLSQVCRRMNLDSSVGMQRVGIPALWARSLTFATFQTVLFAIIELSLKHDGRPEVWKGFKDGKQICLMRKAW